MGLILDDNVVDEVIIGGPAYVSNQLDGGDVIVEGAAGKELLEHLLVGEDTPGTTVTVGFLKGGKTGPKATVELTRMGSNVVADRCRMLELLAKMKTRSSKIKGGDLLVQYVDRVVEMWTNSMVRDGERERQTNQSFVELQNQCGTVLASLSRNLALIGSKVGQAGSVDPPPKPNNFEGPHVLNELLFVTKLKSAESDVLQLISDVQAAREDSRRLTEGFHELDAYLEEQEQEIHTQRATNEILMNAFRSTGSNSDDEDVSTRRFSVHSPQCQVSPQLRRLSGVSQPSLLNPAQEAYAVTQNFVMDRATERDPGGQERALRRQVQELESELERALDSLRVSGQMALAKQEELGMATKELKTLRLELADAGETVLRVQRAKEELEHEVSVLRFEAEQGREFVERLETMEESLSDFQGNLGQDVVCNSMRTLWNELVCALHCVEQLHSSTAHDTTGDKGPSDVASRQAMFSTIENTPGEEQVHARTHIVEIKGRRWNGTDVYRASVNFHSLRVEAGSENEFFLAQVLQQTRDSISFDSQSLVSSSIAAEALSSS
eukprot:3667511-Rhodomonas_salina.2